MIAHEMTCIVFKINKFFKIKFINEYATIEISLLSKLIFIIFFINLKQLKHLLLQFSYTNTPHKII